VIPNPWTLPQGLSQTLEKPGLPYRQFLHVGAENPKDGGIQIRCAIAVFG